MVCLPLAVLLAWLTAEQTSLMIVRSIIAALPLSLWMWFSVQSANTIIKWPALQLVGWTTILISVLAVCLPLHLILPAQTAGQTALIIWIITGLYAVFSAIKIHNRQLKIISAKVSRSYRFIHLSDIHAGSRSRSFVKKVIRQAVSHKPDAVLITGDLLDSSVVDSDYLQPLSDLTCPAWMCLGNHERYVNLKGAINAIENNNTSILRNESIEFEDFCLTGIDDADHHNQVANTLPGIHRDTNKFNVLLYHKPDGWRSARTRGIDLMLCGHTHAGQVWPFGLLVKTQFRYLSGHYSNNNKHLYVSPGTGTWGPILRLGTHCEMTVIDIKPAT